MHTRNMMECAMQFTWIFTDYTSAQHDLQESIHIRAWPFPKGQTLNACQLRHTINSTTTQGHLNNPCVSGHKHIMYPPKDLYLDEDFVRIACWLSLVHVNQTWCSIQMQIDTGVWTTVWCFILLYVLFEWMYQGFKCGLCRLEHRLKFSVRNHPQCRWT